jgi:hypothetical protein
MALAMEVKAEESRYLQELGMTTLSKIIDSFAPNVLAKCSGPLSIPSKMFWAPLTYIGADTMVSAATNPT